jgi:hypothetical protein
MVFFLSFLPWSTRLFEREEIKRRRISPSPRRVLLTYPLRSREKDGKTVSKKLFLLVGKPFQA